MRRRLLIPAGVAVLCAATAWLASGADLAAQEPNPREQVERLLPRLWSEQEGVREQAERELFGMGEAGRREMERLSRDADPRRAVTGLRLLQSERWQAPELREGELPLRPRAEGGLRLEDLDGELDRRFAELRRHMEQMMERVRGLRLPEASGPDGPTGDPWTSWSGMVLDGDRRLAWRLDADGAVRVTESGPDGDESVREADSLDAFRERYPELGARLDRLMPAWSRPPASGWMDELTRRWDDLRQDEHGLGGWRLPEVDWPRLLEDARRGWRREGARPAPSDAPRLGIECEPAGDLLCHHLRLDPGGLVVLRVQPGSRALRLGLRERDVLVTLAGRPVAGPSDVAAALARNGDRLLVATVVRRGERLQLAELPADAGASGDGGDARRDGPR